MVAAISAVLSHTILTYLAILFCHTFWCDLVKEMKSGGNLIHFCIRNLYLKCCSQLHWMQPITCILCMHMFSLHDYLPYVCYFPSASVHLCTRLVFPCPFLMGRRVTKVDKCIAHSVEPNPTIILYLAEILFNI